MVPKGPARKWVGRLRDFLPGFLERHPVLSRFCQRSSLILYGSTARGIDDPVSDLDLWLLLPASELAALDSLSATHFFTFKCDGKPGHIVVRSIEEHARQLQRCHMDTVFQLHAAEVLVDRSGAAADLVRVARLPMRQEVSDAFFFYHYVEMRGEHPVIKSAIERGTPFANLLTVPKMLAHALRAAMVLHGEPYPCDKWLRQAARRTATGRLLEPSVDRMLEHLATDSLRLGGPRSAHPIDRELRVIRTILMDAAREKGRDEPWLTEWWNYMDHACAAVEGVRWQTTDVCGMDE